MWSTDRRRIIHIPFGGVAMASGVSIYLNKEINIEHYVEAIANKIEHYVNTLRQV